MADVLLRGLAKEPSARYPTGAAFVAALEAAGARPWQKIGLRFAAVSAGAFTFGEGASARVISLPSFEIGIYPVTVAQFAAFVAATGYVTQAEREGWGLAFQGSRWAETAGASWRAPRSPGNSAAGREAHPVVQVSRSDAEAFCAWAGVNLPTEEQWEKAARGDDGRHYPWGDRWRPELCNHAGCEARDTVPVDFYPGDASPCGARGLTGNVWEWTASVYEPGSAYSVLRGGAWPHDERFLTTTFRYYALPGYRSDALGFRCILVDERKA